MIPLSLILKTAKWQLVKKIKTDKTEKINNIHINKCLKNNIKRGQGTKKKSIEETELFLLLYKRKDKIYVQINHYLLYQ